MTVGGLRDAPDARASRTPTIDVAGEVAEWSKAAVWKTADDYTPIRDYTDLIMAGKWEEGLKKYDEIEPGRQLLNNFFWHNYRTGVYVVGFWKYWMELKGSSHRVRTPLVNMTAEEEEWLRNRFKLLQEGKHPRSKGELSPYPLQRGAAASAARLSI